MLHMDAYHLFFGASMFIIGAVIGRLSMAIQYALMRPEKKKNTTKKIRENGSLEVSKNISRRIGGSLGRKKRVYSFSNSAFSDSINRTEDSRIQQQQGSLQKPREP